MTKRLTLIMFFAWLALPAQESVTEHRKDDHHDTVCLKEYISKAHWSAHTRTFMMSTFNEGPLKDDYALATGAGISMETKPVRGFQAGVSGFFIYNVFSSEIHKPDALTNQSNRYEIGLFDIQDHENGNDLDRLEELYLKYSFSKSRISFGKLIVNTPFINPQDGRMRPTVTEGIWLELKENKYLELNGGWFRAVSPRSTVKWFSISNSIGVYPMGVNTNSDKSDYSGHIEGNSGIGILNLLYKPQKGYQISIWNAWLENVMNTAVIELSGEQKLNRNTFYQGLILLHQDALNNGGNQNQQFTYMDRGAVSNAVSVQAGIKNKKYNCSVAYTHITGDGRYLMPREWGKEVFYTFMQRERIEGFGDVHAAMGKLSRNFRKQFIASFAYGYVKLPDVRNYRLNKYGMPSYHQINISASYVFSGFLNGMEMKFLAAYKKEAGETYGNLKYVYNKVNMLNLNLILDFKI